MRMWHDLMTEKDRKLLQKQVEKEPRNPEIDDLDSSKMPAEDVELREGSAGKLLHRCYYRWGAVGMWMRLKRLTWPVTIVDLAYEHGLVHESVHRRLLQALRARSERRSQSKLPVWDREEKTLRFKGTVIRKIRSLGVAKNIVAILDGLQAKHRQLRIPTPLDTGQQALHDTIRSLNKGLKKLAFHACDDGQSISWSRR